MKEKILLIYMGGTIGMKTNPATGSLAPFCFEEIGREIPELHKFNIEISTHSFSPFIDSSNVDIENWVELATVIKENYPYYDGFVVLHGTDTMSYTASALSFMLMNLNKPVIFTGSQIPIGVLRTDGRDNLVTAIEIAAAKENGRPIVSEVCVYFENKLFRANRTTKFSAERFNAFRSHNYPPLAEAGIDIKYHRANMRKVDLSLPPFDICTTLSRDVILITLYPGMSREAFSAMSSVPDLKGIVLQTYGSGNASSDGWLSQELKSALDRGIAILNITQCRVGSVNMDLYDTGRHLANMSIISGLDITTESAVTKMMFLLGCGFKSKELYQYLSCSIRGEMSESQN